MEYAIGIVTYQPDLPRLQENLKAAADHLQHGPILIVPSLQSVGTSLVWVAAELVVLIIATMESSRSLSIRFPFGLLLKSVVYALPYLLMGGLVLWLTDSPVLRILISIGLFMAYAVVLEDKVYQTGIIKTLKGIFSK